MPFTTTSLLASVAELLTAAGYRVVDTAVAKGWAGPHSRLFEDAYAVVGVVIYETWSELARHWPESQGSLVDTISNRVGKADPKAWDGYLVLLTPALPDPSSSRELNSIRYDTTRVRKLLAAGDNLHTLEDVRRTLLPLLPMLHVELQEHRKIFDVLVEVLGSRGLERDEVRRLISAFEANESLIGSIYKGPRAL